MNKTIKLIINISLKLFLKKKGQQKSKSYINYSNKKLRPQKGTGKARMGNKKVPTFIGGGRCFPSIFRINKLKINKKMLYYCITKQLFNIKKNNNIIYINNPNNIKLINNSIIIYKNLNNITINIIKKKNIKIIREDKLNPIILNNINNIYLLNNSLKWIRKI